MKIITHMNVDIDAVASVWAWQKLVKPENEFEVVFLSADWQPKEGELKEGDVILDMPAGLKGRENGGASCFVYLQENYFSEKDKIALEKLAKFIDALDRGNVIKILIGGENEILSFTCLNAVLRALQAKYYSDDKVVCERMHEIFDGMLAVALGGQILDLNLERIFSGWVWTRLLGFENNNIPNLKDLIQWEISNHDLAALDKVVQFIVLNEKKDAVEELLGKKNEIISFVSLNGILRAYEAKFQNEEIVCEKMGKIFDGMLSTGGSRLNIEEEAEEKTEWVTNDIAIVRNAKRMGVNGMVFRKGARIIIFVDGDNLGIIRHGNVPIRMDDEIIKKAIGDEEGWFFHEDGYLAARGTRKAPKKTPSRVNPYNLACAADELLGKIKN